MEDDDVKLIWDINIQCGNVIKARRTDLTLVDKKAKSCVIIDVAIPGDCRIRKKEIENIEKYQNLKREQKRLWSVKKVEVYQWLQELCGALARASVNGWTHLLLNWMLEWYKNQSCWEQLGYSGKS